MFAESCSRCRMPLAATRPPAPPVADTPLAYLAPEPAAPPRPAAPDAGSSFAAWGASVPRPAQAGWPQEQAAASNGPAGGWPPAPPPVNGNGHNNGHGNGASNGVYPAAPLAPAPSAPPQPPAADSWATRVAQAVSTPSAPITPAAPRPPAQAMPAPNPGFGVTREGGPPAMPAPNPNFGVTREGGPQAAPAPNPSFGVTREGGPQAMPAPNPNFGVTREGGPQAAPAPNPGFGVTREGGPQAMPRPNPGFGVTRENAPAGPAPNPGFNVIRGGAAAADDLQFAPVEGPILPRPLSPQPSPGEDADFGMIGSTPAVPRPDPSSGVSRNVPASQAASILDIESEPPPGIGRPPQVAQFGTSSNFGTTPGSLAGKADAGSLLDMTSSTGDIREAGGRGWRLRDRGDEEDTAAARVAMTNSGFGSVAPSATGPAPWEKAARKPKGGGGLLALFAVIIIGALVAMVIMVRPTFLTSLFQPSHTLSQPQQIASDWQTQNTTMAAAASQVINHEKKLDHISDVVGDYYGPAGTPAAPGAPAFWAMAVKFEQAPSRDSMIQTLLSPAAPARAKTTYKTSEEHIVDGVTFTCGTATFTVAGQPPLARSFCLWADNDVFGGAVDLGAPDLKVALNDASSARAAIEH